MIVGQTSRVHQHPALLGVRDGAVVADESTAAALVVDTGMVERDVDGVGGCVVVGLQIGLLVGPVPNDEVHQGSGRRLKHHNF